MLAEFERMWFSMGHMMVSPDMDSVVPALLTIILAWLVGWAAGRLIGQRIEAGVAAQFLGTSTRRVTPILRSGLAALVLWGGIGNQIATGDGLLLMAAALALAVALVAYNMLRGLSVGQLSSTGLALLIFTGLLVAQLGGLGQLIAGLDAAAVPIGKRTVTLLDIVNTIIVVTLLIGGTRLIAGGVTRWIGSISALDLAQRVLFQKLAQVALLVIAAGIGINLLGIDLTAFAVFSGAFGLAVGFGFQKTFGNLLSGLILLMDRSIKPGDVIAVGDTFGWVNKIGVRYVSLLTRDGKEHLIPNESMVTGTVENWSYSSKDVRLHIELGVAHGCDVRLAQRLMVEAATAHPRVLAEPEPVAWITKFSNNAIEHDLRVWIDDPENGVAKVKGEILLRIWDLFREHGVTLPFNQQDVYLRTVEEKPD